MSERALFDPAEMRGRAQLETLLLFYDPAVFDFWDARYRELRGHAGVLDIPLTRAELEPEEVPDLQEASQKGMVLVEVPVPVAVPPVLTERVEKLWRQYRQLVDTLPFRNPWNFIPGFLPASSTHDS